MFYLTKRLKLNNTNTLLFFAEKPLMLKNRYKALALDGNFTPRLSKFSNECNFSHRGATEV